MSAGPVRRDAEVLIEQWEIFRTKIDACLLGLDAVQAGMRLGEGSAVAAFRARLVAVSAAVPGVVREVREQARLLDGNDEPETEAAPS